MARHTRQRRSRPGGSLVESALILTCLLTLILGMIDLGLGVMRFNMISHAAREGARQMMVHGGSALSHWGTLSSWQASVSGQPLVDAISPQLVGCDLTQTYITVAWATNNIGDPVSVTITTKYQPLMTYLFGAGPMNLKAESTTLFAH
jgi:Flp pilus assembly protein TadG